MALATPDFLQVKTYTAKALRAALMDRTIQSGVYGSGDFMVTQRGAGATMSVDTAVGSAWVLGTTSSRQGAYHIYNDATINVTVNANASGNPRIDQVVLHVYDSIDGGAGTDTAAIEVIQGVATVGATLNNRTGAAALPANCLLLADVLVANGAASITNTVIRDRRPWCRGAFWRVALTSAPASSAVAISPTNVIAAALQGRLETGNNPVRTTLTIVGTTNTSAAGGVDVGLAIDGAAPDGLASTTSLARWYQSANTAAQNTLGYDYVTGPVGAGSHVFVPTFGPVSTGTAGWVADATHPIIFAVEEIVRPTTPNNAVTSG